MGFGILLGPSRTILGLFWTKAEKSDKYQKNALVLGWGTTSKVLKMLGGFWLVVETNVENQDIHQHASTYTCLHASSRQRYAAAAMQLRGPGPAPGSKQLHGCNQLHGCAGAALLAAKRCRLLYCIAY